MYTFNKKHLNGDTTQPSMISASRVRTSIRSTKPLLHLVHPHASRPACLAGQGTSLACQTWSFQVARGHAPRRNYDPTVAGTAGCQLSEDLVRLKPYHLVVSQIPQNHPCLIRYGNKPTILGVPYFENSHIHINLYNYSCSRLQIYNMIHPWA